MNLPNYRHETPLILAIVNDNQPIIDCLLNHPQQLCNLNHISPLYGTALTTAIFYNHDELAKRLIEKQGEKFCSDAHPAAFNWAIRHQKLELVALLIEKGASVNNFGNEQYDKNSVPNWIWQEVPRFSTPLYNNPRSPIVELPIILAAKTNNLNLVKLIAKHADVNKKGLNNKSVIELIKDNHLEVSESVKDFLLKNSASTLSDYKGNIFNSFKNKENTIKEKISKLVQELSAEYPDDKVTIVNQFIETMDNFISNNNIGLNNLQHGNVTSELSKSTACMQQ